jgi:hypothetical protein
MNNKYFLRKEEKSFCPSCKERVYLLAREDGFHPNTWFYICWICQEVRQVGHGKVEYEKEGVRN